MARLKSTSNLNVSVSQMDKENNSNHHHLLFGGELLSPSRPPLPPLLRYLRNRSGSPPLPLSPLDNIAWSPNNNNSPTHYAGTPIKVDEDGILVMDGISLPSTGTAGRFSRSSTSATDSSPSSSSSSGGRSLNKTDICHSWGEFGTCRYGFKCQFAHGKEELRPPRFSARNKSDSSINRSKSRFLNQIMAVGGGMTIQTESPTKLPLPVDDTSCKIPTATISIITSRDDWSPQDDGIEVVLPHSSTAEPPSQKDVDAYIHGVLCGPSSRKRLPVFAEICSE